jgi:ABC-type branched-subunit amino acid transport system substrate-binding protein
MVNRATGAGALRLAGIGAAALALSAGSAAAQSGDTLKLASIAPATGSMVVIGTAQNVAVRLAVKEINEKGGIMGRQVQLILGDTQSDPTQAASAAKRLAYDEKVHAVIGPLVTQEVIPAVQVFTEAKIPQISTTGSAAVTPQMGPYHFSFNNSSETQAVVMARFAKETLKAKTIAILADDGGQSKSGVAFLKTHAPTVDLKIVAEQEYRNSTDDMTPQVLSIRRANPDAVLFFTSTIQDLRQLLTGRKDLGWNAPIVGQLSVPTYGPTLGRQIGGEAFTGVYGQNYAGLTYCTNDAAGAGEFVKFQDRLWAFSPENKGKLPATTALYMYDSVYLMKAALDAIKSTDAEKFKEWMYKSSDTVTTLVTAKGLSPSPQSHFLFGPNAYVMAERPDQLRADGLMKRAGC